jgi:predicted dehydrogenase
VPTFATHSELIASGAVDAVIISTPHYYHPPIAIDAFEAGLHVLTEKPAGVDCASVREMCEAAKRSGKTFGVMFNQRANKLFAEAKRIMDSGELGELKRMVWIITNWYRKQEYYDSGEWRATWSGEGGGVLINQAPHNLDLMQWICGMPKKVRGFCAEAKYHNIEVEDEANIYAEYENGATACFLTSTGEFPGTNRLEISGDRGKIVIEEGKLKFTKLLVSEREFCFSNSESFARIPSETVVIEQTEKEKAHSGILQNFANCILKGEPLLSPGYEGINEVTIHNAAYLSSWTDKWVELPLDPAVYKAELMKKCAESEIGAKTAKKHNHNMEYNERWSVRW